MTSRSDKYRRASAEIYSPQQLADFRNRFASVTQAFPDEQARVTRQLRETGLEGHRLVIEHYLRNKSPLPQAEINSIGIYADTTYALPNGQGRQPEGGGASSGSLAQKLYGDSTPGEGEPQAQRRSLIG